ncbi:MAG: hypothetical protein JWO67_6478 [Streptosporangiaceae bacterium]|nr:hypothetical protein [Streptosporangiaceae bacterium]
MRSALLAPLVILLAACTPLYAPPPAPVATSAPPAALTQDSGLAPASVTPNGVQTLPASSHVTGMPYPAQCALGKTSNGDWMPDPRCTPGAASAAVTQANIHSTICVSGYTAKIRPPVSETGPVKKAAMKAYGESATTSINTELDHDVPLELGGSNDITNLWPQPSDLPGQGFRNKKDTVENDLKRAVCAGTVKLADAQNLIASDWTTAERNAGLS